MRRLIAILSITAMALTAVSMLLSLFAIRNAEREKNRERTQAARNARWRANGTAPEVAEVKLETSSDEQKT